MVFFFFNVYLYFLNWALNLHNVYVKYISKANDIFEFLQIPLGGIQGRLVYTETTAPKAARD